MIGSNHQQRLRASTLLYRLGFEDERIHKSIGGKELVLKAL